MSPLGKGGFAEVYLAEHIHLRYLVAIKFLHADLGKLESQFSDESCLVQEGFSDLHKCRTDYEGVGIF